MSLHPAWFALVFLAVLMLILGAIVDSVLLLVLALLCGLAAACFVGDSL